MDPDPDTLARWALDLRERGRSYRVIGEILEVSKGTAYRLVQRGREICLEQAHVVMRAPSRPGEPTRERAEELLDRLRGDFERVRTVVGNLADPTELARMPAEFNQGADLLAALIFQQSGRKRGLAKALNQLTRAFHAILGEASRLEAFAQEVNSEHVADVFREDVLGLAAIISPRAKPQLPRWEAGEPDGPGEGAQQSTERHLLNRSEREGRDLQIVLARAQGTSQREIAERHGITDRQVRRVLAAQRQQAPALNQQSAEELSGAVLAACRRAVEIGEGAKEQVLPGEFASPIPAIMDSVALMKDIGAIPAEGLRGMRWRRTDRLEVVPRINQRLREVLGSAGCDSELIGRATDVVVAEALPELAQWEADIVQA